MTQEYRNAFGNVYLTVTVDRENKWVHTDWMGYLTEESLKAGALAYTDALRKAGFNCVLNDTSKVIGSWDHSVEWVVKEWAPQAARAGLRHFAMVTTPQTFAESSASAFYSNLKAFEARVFDNISAARQWLRQFSIQNTNRWA
ncbi:STAS/SEC14 domain-containing protein [Rufibacter roseolus]|uniref:STAS/SEC14 domain-containing protein n=1 Tax=Rufibacter roseolus TaxID=2817375 RepID=UPI001B30A2FE|nr:STAS/SEC14 domain-containing protein [Rufibacter roseolus]